ncbi:MAG: serine hydrolase [Ignavibacteriales bacterium]
MKRVLFLSVIIFVTNFSAQPKMNLEDLKTKIQNYIDEIHGVVAVSFINMENGERFNINADEEFHAASTMKLPVMIELFRQSEFGDINLLDSIIIKNEFISIADSSKYSLSKNDDSDDEIYSLIGKKLTVLELCHRMITKSSNLATNILIEFVDAKKIMHTMRNVGAQRIKVLRGVEDIHAFQKGMNNVTTANDLAIILESMIENHFTSEKSTIKMIDILLEQEHNDLIPKLLPTDVKVAHKTGWITGIMHDAGIIFLPDGRKYVLVLLTKNLADENSARLSLQKISYEVYKYFNENK